MNRLDTNNAICQKDNAAIHTSKLRFWTDPISLQI